MKQDDYQKKIDEHRQAIDAEDDIRESRRSRRSSYSKKTKKSKNMLLPSLFFVFILIPVCIFIYVQFFYEPPAEEAEGVEQEVIQVETKPITNIPDNDDKEDEGSNEDATEKEEQNSETTQDVKDEQEEPKEEEKTEPKEEPQVNTETKTHIVKSNETLYRIAMNYYKDPNAVEKIKAANGLTSNSISVGQKLILP